MPVNTKIEGMTLCDIVSQVCHQYGHSLASILRPGGIRVAAPGQMVLRPSMPRRVLCIAVKLATM